MKFIWILIISTILGYSQAYIQVEKNSYTVKEDIGVFITGMSGDAKDWIGIFPVGSSNDWENVLSWTWTDGASDVTIRLPKIVETGQYEVRAFFRNTYRLEARSKVFEVTESGNGSLELTVPKYHRSSCQRHLFVDFKNMGGNNNDWIALYPVNSNNDWGNIVLWKWIKNMENASVDLNPQENFELGEYEIRAFFNNSFDVEGVSNPIFVTPCHNAPNITTSRKEYFKNESITVNFENMSGESNNWIGIYKKGTRTLAQNNVAWQWTGDRENGQLIFDNLPQGEYDVRAFYNNNYIIQQLTSFKITNLDKNNFPQALLDDTKNPTLDIQVIYSKNKNRAYIFIDGSENALFSQRYKGITVVDNSNPNNPTVLAYLKDKTWKKNTMNLTENENILAFIDKNSKIITLESDNLTQFDSRIFYSAVNLNKANNINLFYVSSSNAWQSHSPHFYFHISEAGVIKKITNLIIDPGAKSSNYIIDEGTIDFNKYFITYRRRNSDRDMKWESVKKIYNIENLPNIALIETIIFDIEP